MHYPVGTEAAGSFEFCLVFCSCYCTKPMKLQVPLLCSEYSVSKTDIKGYLIKLVIINRDKQRRIFCSVYLTITKSRKIFVIFLEASVISSTRCSFSIGIFILPIPCVLVGSATEKIHDTFNMTKSGFKEKQTL